MKMVGYGQMKLVLSGYKHVIGWLEWLGRDCNCMPNMKIRNYHLRSRGVYPTSIKLLLKFYLQHTTTFDLATNEPRK